MLCAFLVPLFAGEVVLDGRVIDDNKSPVEGARIFLRPVDEGPVTETRSSLTGAFTLRASPGVYLLTVEREGYFAVRDREIAVEEEPEELEIALPHIRQTSESVNVSALLPPVDVEGTASVRRITGRQILDVPYPATRNFRNALRIMPGVVQGRGGRLHFDGAMENQVFYTLNGFNISDPVSGRFNTRLTVEAIRSIDYSSGRYSPEFGKGSAGALAIQTASGDDRFRYSVTNFVPGLDTRTGIHIGNWAPRLSFSGPIRKGRAWFSESIDTEYDTSVILELPPGQNRMRRVRGGSILHGQVNVTAWNILTADFLASREIAPRTGLSALDPLSTSVDRRMDQSFWSLKDQIFLGHGMLLEIGLAHTRTGNDERPQGTDYYRITPNGRAGNHFVSATQRAERSQFLGNLFLPRFHLAGVHQLKTGVDLNWLEYNQDSRRTGYENYDVYGQLLTRVTFGGSNRLRLPNREAAGYIVDVWELRPDLRLEYGARIDGDRLVGANVVSPRAAVAWSPARLPNTRFSGGYAVIHDASSLAIFSRPFDQYAVTSVFRPNGVLESGPYATVFDAGSDIRNVPRSRNWSFGAEQHITARMRISMNLLRRRGDNGFTYVAAQQPDSFIDGIPVASTFRLTNLRRDSYDSASVTLHHSFGREYEYMASYTRSRSLSNAVIDMNVDQPLQVRDNFGRLGWDVPDRFVSWGYLPGWNRNWGVAYLVDWRTGYPFSIQRDTGELIGAVNSERFPANFSLNLHLERKLRWRHHKFAVRAGVNNVTNHLNATGVNNVIDSPQFRHFYGKEGRHIVFRIRLLSRE